VDSAGPFFYCRRRGLGWAPTKYEKLGFHVILYPSLVFLSPSPSVILSGVKDLGFRLRVNSAKDLGFRLRINSAKGLVLWLRINSVKYLNTRDAESVKRRDPSLPSVSQDNRRVKFICFNFSSSIRLFNRQPATSNAFYFGINPREGP
jgi:hypothetical protein